MHTVQDLLDRKGNHKVWSCRPQQSVYEALRLMAEANVGVLLVMQGDRVIGIFSERDYARKVILEERSSKNTSVGQVMTEEVLYVEPDDSLEACMALMTAKRVRHLPVLKFEQLQGVISIGDVVKEVVSDRDFMIDQLTRYITGGYTSPIVQSSIQDSGLKEKILHTHM